VRTEQYRLSSNCELFLSFVISSVKQIFCHIIFEQRKFMSESGWVLTSADTTRDFIIIFNIACVFFYEDCARRSFYILLRTSLIYFALFYFSHCLLRVLVMMIIWRRCIGMLLRNLIHNLILLCYDSLLFGNFLLIHILGEALI